MLRRFLPVAALVVGVVAMLPPYTGPDLRTETRVEVADHVVPGVLLLAVVVASIYVTRQRPAPTWLLATGLVILLAGIWMTATHLPLLAQAARDEVSTGGALYHSVPGFLVIVLGMTWTAVHWRHGS